MRIEDTWRHQEGDPDTIEECCDALHDMLWAHAAYLTTVAKRLLREGRKVRLQLELTSTEREEDD